MNIEKITVTIKELCEGYTNDEKETDVPDGVYAYGGKLCVRPAFQRSFVYKQPQESAVIDTALKGFPLNIMYWVDNGDGTYDCLDGQQRTISLCNFFNSYTSYYPKDGGRPQAINWYKRNEPDKLQKFYDYKLEVYVCSGEKSELMEWFKIINIAGEKLSDQELRNINYVSPWLTDAKRYFSRVSPNGKCPAENLGSTFVKKEAHRQNLLEQVLYWIANEKSDEAICQYMEDHVQCEDASELWNYYNDVIKWATTLFQDITESSFHSIEWGLLYNKYKDNDFNPDEINEEYYKLMTLRAKGELLTTSKVNVIQYCITHNEELLKHRYFDDTLKNILYHNQKGICPKCGKHYQKSEMEAHHIKSWRSGGLTTIENGEMICVNCHHEHHAD